MQRAAITAQRPAGRKSTRGRQQQASDRRASPDELAGFYAGLVNGDRYLPPSTISNASRLRNRFPVAGGDGESVDTGASQLREVG